MENGLQSGLKCVLKYIDFKQNFQGGGGGGGPGPPPPQCKGGSIPSHTLPPGVSRMLSVPPPPPGDNIFGSSSGKKEKYTWGSKVNPKFLDTKVCGHTA